MKFLQSEAASIQQWHPYRYCGALQRITGHMFEVRGLDASLGEMCKVSSGTSDILAEVIELHHDTSFLLPITPLVPIRVGAEVIPLRRQPSVSIPPNLLGKVINGLGLPLGKYGPLPTHHLHNIHASPPSPDSRQLIEEIFPTGIKAIDSFLTIGKGQRLGVFSGPGCGKSSLLSSIAHHSPASITIYALIGERGREVRETILHHAPQLQAQKTILVVSPSHEPASMKVLAGRTAMTLAEFFRNQGHDVLLIMDSLSRWVSALQEVAVARGEPTTAGHYSASVFHDVAHFVERAGNNHVGTITAFFSILHYADHPDIFTDYIRSLLDGHIILSPPASTLTSPAIDIVNSLSRAARNLIPPHIDVQAEKVRSWLRKYLSALDIIHLGAYIPGHDHELDEAIRMLPECKAFLSQSLSTSVDIKETWQLLKKLTKDYDK